MKRESPMPIGAKKVPLCFSAASKKIVITSCAVKNISMTVSVLVDAPFIPIDIYLHKPCATEVPPPRVVATFMGPGNVAYTTPEAAMLPKICATKTRAARVQPTAPIKAIPRVTAGLNKPPDTRKKTHALTAKLNPKPSAIYVSALELGT